MCGNVGKLLNNLKFTLAMENEMMGLIMDDGMTAANAAKKYIRKNPAILDNWLAGVTTTKGEPGLAAVNKSLGL